MATITSPVIHRFVWVYSAHRWPTTKSIAIKSALETRRANTGFENIRNGTAAGKQETKTRQKQAMAPKKSSQVIRPAGGHWTAGETREDGIVDRLAILWPRERRDVRLHFISKDTERGLTIGGKLNRTNDARLLALVGHAVHDVHDAIDDAPGEIAAQRRQQELAHSGLALRDSEAGGECDLQHHNESETELHPAGWWDPGTV
jgi:hypothetical protein